VSTGRLFEAGLSPEPVSTAFPHRVHRFLRRNAAAGSKVRCQDDSIAGGVPNLALVREVRLRASGADIHDVNGLIWAYEEACQILNDEAMRRELLLLSPQLDEEVLLRWAIKCRKTYEKALYAYVGGTSIKTLIATSRFSQFRSRLRTLVDNTGYCVRSLRRVRHA